MYEVRLVLAAIRRSGADVSIVATSFMDDAGRRQLQKLLERPESDAGSNRSVNFAWDRDLVLKSVRKQDGVVRRAA